MESVLPTIFKSFSWSYIIFLLVTLPKLNLKMVWRYVELATLVGMTDCFHKKEPSHAKSFKFHSFTLNFVMHSSNIWLIKLKVITRIFWRKLIFILAFAYYLLHTLLSIKICISNRTWVLCQAWDYASCCTKDAIYRKYGSKESKSGLRSEYLLVCTCI